jgi:glycosyltransferase involved in cell wall biosynthesis
MPVIKPKLLVFMLSRTGCIPYATKMVNTLTNLENHVFVSGFSPEELPKDSHKVRTYRNAIEFLISSIFVLPVLCFKVLSLKFSWRFTTVYFPVFHHWNPTLIFLCKILGSEVIFTVHDGLLHAGEQKNWEQKMLNYCIRKADKLVFLSEYVKSLTQKEIGFIGKSCIIPHPLLKSENTPVKTRQLPAKPSLLFLGRVVEYKGIDLLLEAVQNIPDSTLGKMTIAGHDYSGYHAKYKDSHAVNWINRWLEESEMKALLDSHDILILPYIEASQSGIITLGIVSGIPMICTNVGGLMEQLDQKEALFVEPNVEAIREGILKLAQDGQLYRSIHENLLLKAENENEPYQTALSAFIREEF